MLQLLKRSNHTSIFYKPHNSYVHLLILICIYLEYTFLLAGKHKSKDLMIQLEYNFLKIKYNTRINFNVSNFYLISKIFKVEFDSHDISTQT